MLIVVLLTLASTGALYAVTVFTTALVAIFTRRPARRLAAGQVLAMLVAKRAENATGKKSR